VLAAQNITDGVVQIQVIEGRLEDIQIEGQKRLNPDYIRSRIRLGATTPLRVDRLEDQLRLLKADPLFESFDASLRSGKEIGQSVLVVRVKEANPFYGNLNIDNYSPPSVGSERLGVALAYRNLTGNGDELAGSYYRSTTGGSNVFDFSYRVPLNPMNGTLQLRTVLDRNKVTQAPFERLNIEGESNIYEISVRQPLIRTPREEFALSLGFSYKDGQTFLFDRTPFPFGIGADANGVTRTSVFRFGQDYVSRDRQGAWLARSQFSLGTGLLDATINKSPIPDSRFFSWLGQVQRVQRLGNDHLLLIQGDVQLTPDSLLPSEQFVIGGGQSLRGYRQNVRSGDNGFRFSVEDRITLQRNDAGVSIFQLAPFIDLGSIWNHPDNPNKLPRQTFLASAGLGLLWEPVPRLSLRLDYAIPFIDLDDRGTNAQDNGFFFSVNYRL
jgi:hemolysin activation/secretion protein